MVHFTIIIRGTIHVLKENTVKVPYAAKSAVKGYFADAEIGGFQQLVSLSDSEAVYKIIESEVVFCEQPAQIYMIYINRFCNVF